MTQPPTIEPLSADILAPLEAEARSLWSERQGECAKHGANISMPEMSIPVDLLATIIAAARAQSHQASSEVEREAVARVIDPESWAEFDKAMLLALRFEERVRDQMREDWAFEPNRRSPSLAKADAILALLQPIPTKGEWTEPEIEEDAPSVTVRAYNGDTSKAFVILPDKVIVVHATKDGAVHSETLQRIYAPAPWPERAEDVAWLKRKIPHQNAASTLLKREAAVAIDSYNTRIDRIIANLQSSPTKGEWITIPVSAADLSRKAFDQLCYSMGYCDEEMAETYGLFTDVLAAANLRPAPPEVK